MKLVGYLRVSTASQVDDGQGLEIQEETIRGWARRHNHRIVRWYRDEGVSGSSESREGLEDALMAIKFNGADGIAVASLDRLARSLTVQEAALQQVWTSEGRVFSVDTGEVVRDDPDDPVRTFVRHILGAVSQLEAAMIARRLRRGRTHKAASGGYAHGAPPFGYRAEGGRLNTFPTEQNVIQLMMEMREAGLSFRRIAEQLNSDGFVAKRGGRWHPQSVARVIARDAE